MKQNTQTGKNHKCKCRLVTRVCNNKQRCNKDKCRSECKEFIDKFVCKKKLIWNLSSSECECDKSCDVGEYLDYENCKCRKTIVNKLVEECTENVEKVNLGKLTTSENENKLKGTLHIVLLAIIFTINVGIGLYFVYYKYMNHWYLKRRCYSCYVWNPYSSNNLINL